MHISPVALIPVEISRNILLCGRNFHSPTFVDILKLVTTKVIFYLVGIYKWIKKIWENLEGQARVYLVFLGLPSCVQVRVVFNDYFDNFLYQKSVELVTINSKT